MLTKCFCQEPMLVSCNRDQYLFLILSCFCSQTRSNLFLQQGFGKVLEDMNHPTIGVVRSGDTYCSGRKLEATYLVSCAERFTLDFSQRHINNSVTLIYPTHKWTKINYFHTLCLGMMNSRVFKCYLWKCQYRALPCFSIGYLNVCGFCLIIFPTLMLNWA